MQASVGEFLKPRVVKVTPTTAKQAKVVIEPFERGFGHTVGNSLRRILLSSLEGSAVTRVRIQGVQHEFATIPGVVEDVTDVILNLKDIVLVSHSDEPVTLRLDERGPADVTAQDIHVADTAAHVKAAMAEGLIPPGDPMLLAHGVVANNAWNTDIDTSLGLFLRSKDVDRFQDSLESAAKRRA
jgi:hypothetical protein